MIKEKGEVVSVHTMNACRGHRGISPPIVNCDTGSWVPSLFMPKGQPCHCGLVCRFDVEK